MDDITRVFIHGLYSSSQGTKALYFKEHYPDMIVEDYRGPVAERMEKLNAVLADKENIILVGSSLGGLMAAMYACDNEKKIKKLIMLAPALILKDFDPYLDRKSEIPTIIYHGSRDDVVPIDPVLKIASNIFSNLTHHIVDDDHPLREEFRSMDWDNMLR